MFILITKLQSCCFFFIGAKKVFNPHWGFWAPGPSRRARQQPRSVYFLVICNSPWGRECSWTYCSLVIFCFRIASIYVIYQCWCERKDAIDGIYGTTVTRPPIAQPARSLDFGIKVALYRLPYPKIS